MSGTSFTAANQSDLVAALAAIAADTAPIGAPLAAYTITLTASFAITGAVTASVNAGGDSVTIANAGHVISGTGSLVVGGSGTVVLAGNNVFSGGITFQAGTLELAARGGAGAGIVSLTGGATLPQVLRIDGTRMPINPITGQSGPLALVDLPNIAATTPWGTIDVNNVLTIPTASGSVSLTYTPFVSIGPRGESVINFLADGTGGTYLESNFLYPSAAVTVFGAGGGIVSSGFNDITRNASVQAALANPVNAGVIAGTVLAMDYTGPVAANPAGTIEVLMHQAAAIALPDTPTVVVSDAAGAVSVIGGSAYNSLVLTGAGGLTYVGGSGQGSVVAGGGDNAVYIPAGAVGQYVDLGAGNDTIVATGGTDLLSPGLGRNMVWLGAGADYVKAEGTDTIVGGAGNAIIDATKGLLAANVLAWLGPAGSSVYGGMGRSTIIGGAGNDLMETFGGASQLWLGSGADTVLSAGADTIVGGSGAGSVTALGNAIMFGGSGALIYAGSVTSTLVGGAGNITGSGGGLVIGGGGTLNFQANGATTVVGGAGAATVNSAGLMVGGTGALVFNNFANNYGNYTGIGGTVVTNPLGSATINSGAYGSHLLLYDNGNTTYDQLPPLYGQYYGNDAIIAQSGSLTVPLAVGMNITAMPGVGHSHVTVGGGSNVTGGGDGDVLVAQNVGPKANFHSGLYVPFPVHLTAGAGAAVVSAAGFLGDLTIAGGSGADQITGGDGYTTIMAGSGAATIAVGLSTNYTNGTLFSQQTATTLVFAAGNASSDLIRNFVPSFDFISLQGFPAGEAAADFAAATVTGGGDTLMTLSDGTHLTFAGVSGLGLGNFV